MLFSKIGIIFNWFSVLLFLYLFHVAWYIRFPFSFLLLITGCIKTFWDYFTSTPTYGSHGMCVLWGLAVISIRHLEHLCCATWVFVTTCMETFTILSWSVNSVNLQLRPLTWFIRCMAKKQSVMQGVSSGTHAPSVAEHHWITWGLGDLPRVQPQMLNMGKMWWLVHDDHQRSINNIAAIVYVSHETVCFNIHSIA